MKKHIFITLFLALAAIGTSFAQTEYLVKLDETNCSITKVGKLDSMKWLSSTAYDAKHSKYYIVGSDDSVIKTVKIYTVDVTTGKIVNSRAIIPGLTLFNLAYSEQYDTLYCIRWDNTLQKEYLSCIDPLTGAVTDILYIPGVNGISIDIKTIDQTKGLYYILGSGGTGTTRLLTIDLKNRTIAPPQYIFPHPYASFIHFEYDAALDKIVGIYVNGVTANKLFLATITPATGSIGIIDTIRGATAIFMGRTCYNPTAQHYIFNCNDTVMASQLYTMDIAAKVLYHPTFLTPKGGGSPINDNLVYPFYNRNTDDYYALFWEAKTIPDTTGNPDTTLAVKPINNSVPGSCLTIPTLFAYDNNSRFEIRSSCPVGSFKMHIYNLTGQRVFQTNDIGNSWDGSCNGNPTAAGTYYYHIELRTTDGKTEQRKGRVTLIR